MKNAIIFIIALAVSGIALAESPVPAQESPAPAQNYGKYPAPFGLQWGMSIEEVTAMGVTLTPHPSKKDVYSAKALPKNLSDGEIYILRFKRGFGLVRVGALTSAITLDLDGAQGKERYNRLRTAISNIYGDPDEVHERTGAARVFDDSNQFYECLLFAGCGYWVSFWGKQKNDGNILLEIRGLERGSGRVDLFFESAALDTAEEREKEENDRDDEKALK